MVLGFLGKRIIIHNPQIFLLQVRPDSHCLTPTCTWVGTHKDTAVLCMQCNARCEKVAHSYFRSVMQADWFIYRLQVPSKPSRFVSRAIASVQLLLWVCAGKKIMRITQRRWLSGMRRYLSTKKLNVELNALERLSPESQHSRCFW